MTTLYIREPGVGIRRSGQRLIVYKGDGVLQTVRLRDVERLVLFGSVEVSAPVWAALLEGGIETVLLSFGGKFRGRLAPADGKNIFLRRTQFQRYEDREYRLRVGKEIVTGKVRNARAVLQQYARNHPSEALAGAIVKLEAARERAARQASLDALLGAEGEAASLYFGALGTMIRAEFAFTTRNRRPPRDPVNALLSFGYTLLTTELTGALAAQGLDPHVGLLHDLDYGRPSLALDVLEEFRQPVVDRLAVSLINRGVLTLAHFDDRGEAGVFLNDAGRPRFLEFYHRAMDAEFQEDRLPDQRTSYRGLFRRQARRMRLALENAADYAPYVAR
ncbi:MAG: CRISPR-associated endonuclease Cas1 [Armatimonadota bacterium]|nr:CRISPR-associated endonuclease Cas1 [Armatimonadota bacterium]